MVFKSEGATTVLETLSQLYYAWIRLYNHTIGASSLVENEHNHERAGL
jgi:hypothetical protein